VHEVPRFRLGDGLPAFVQLHQGSSTTKFQDDVDKVGVLEVAEQLAKQWDVLATEWVVF
jgi:hypothetical protein